MMGEAAPAAGVDLIVLAAALDDPAVATSTAAVVGDARDPDALAELARRVDVVTFDHELVDLDAVAGLEREGVSVRPGAAALRFAVDKAFQRRRLDRAGLPVPRFAVGSRGVDVVAFLGDVAGDVVVKAARGGYDGRAVWFPSTHDEARRLVDDVDGECVVEERLSLVGEAAQLVVRSTADDVVAYPLVSTVQRDGMCVEVTYPAQCPPGVSKHAAELATRLARLIDVVGVLAVEVLVTREGLFVNEVALRPHNTGHWTIEGCATSQFVNHLLAVSAQALGDPRATTPAAAMVNVVGGREPANPDAAAATAGVAVHDYAKAWRPGRKLGHVTALGVDAASARVTAWAGAVAYGTSTEAS